MSSADTVDALLHISDVFLPYQGPLRTVANVLESHSGLVAALVDLVASGASTSSVEVAIRQAMIEASEDVMRAKYPHQ